MLSKYVIYFGKWNMQMDAPYSLSTHFMLFSGIAPGYGLDNWGFESPAGAGNFSFYHRVQTGSGAHPASYPMGARGSFPGDKAAGREDVHPPPSNAEVKEWVEL
jgi:hypothetical protein